MVDCFVWTARPSLQTRLLAEGEGGQVACGGCTALGKFSRAEASKGDYSEGVVAWAQETLLPCEDEFATGVVQLAHNSDY